MRVLCLLALASVTFAQEQTQFAGQFYGPLASGTWNPQVLIHPKPLLPVVFLTAAPPPSATCSVPLSKARISEDVHYAERHLTPRADQLAPLPQSRVPAPSC